MAEPTLRVRVLGGCDLRLGEARVPPLDSGRAESLLAYLLLHRHAPQPRQRLAFLLWPDSTEAQARTNLRHVLHNLRRALPDADRFIEASPRTLQWRSAAPLWLDVEVFERAVAEGRLQEAIDIYGGDLLEGSYDEWLLEERERLVQLHRDALERLARELEAGRRWSESIAIAERLLLRDPLREESYQLLMRLCHASGDRARAVRVYHSCAAILQRELGLAPSPATQAAYEAVLPAAPDRRAPVGAAASPAPPRLVGRAPELERLSALWRSARQGNPQLVLVTGEPGVGKSRLVEELRSRCRQSGALTAEARAYPAEGAMAYGLLCSWLRSERIAARRHRLGRPELSELARLLPELLTELPQVGAPELLPETEQRQRLFAACARAILAAGEPLLLVADDLQWCDVQTLQFVHYLLRAQPEARLLVAATARREELDPGHPVIEVAAGLQALDRFGEIELRRLGRQATAELAEAIAGRQLSHPELERLYGESEGNPLFVVETLRARSDSAQPAGAASSGRIQALIASRLARLSEPASELVGVAAAIGRAFTVDVLASASDLDERELVRGLDELWRRGLVRAHGPSSYDFSHGKIREAAYVALSPARRRRTHLRVAQALERTHPRDLDAVSGLLAVHCDRAGAVAEAVGWYARAARAAQRLHAHAQAVQRLERALALAARLPAGERRAALELELLAALPPPLAALEGYASERLARVHERALALALEFGLEPEPPIVWSLALASLTRGDFGAAHDFGEQLRSRAERDGDEVLWVESAYILGVSAYWLGQLDVARAHLQSALERCRPEQRTAHVVRYGQDPELVCRTRLAHALWLMGRHDEADRCRDAALALVEESRHAYSRAVALVWLGILAVDQHDHARLRRHVDAIASVGLAEAPQQISVPAEAFAGYLDVVDGRIESGLAGLRRALDATSSGESPAPGLPGFIARALLDACLGAGRPRAGLAVADAALGSGRGSELWEAETRRLRAHCLVALGADAGEVEAELLRAVAAARAQGARSFELRARDSLAAVAAGAAERSRNGAPGTITAVADSTVEEP